MSGPAVTALTSLKRIDPVRARAGNALLRLFAGGVEAALTDMHSSPEYWFISGPDIAFAMAADGVAPVAGDIDSACDMLDAAESLLTLAEGLLGMPLEPLDLKLRAIVADGLDGALVASLAAERATLWLAVRPDDEDVARWEASAQPASAALGVVPVPLALRLTAARVSLDEAAGISSGDLLLLPRRMVAVAVAQVTSGSGETDGIYDGQSGAFTAGATIFESEEKQMAENEQDGIAPAAMGFAVPVTLRLPDQAVDSETLAALRPGHVLPLSPLVQGLQVELLVGGQRIARGEIVEMGESFAVHIDERVAVAAASPPPDAGETDAEAEA